MKMKQLTISLLICATALTSCIRDNLEPCRPLTLMLDIEDRNFSNVDDIEGMTPVDKDDPFANPVPVVHARLTDAATGETVEEFTATPDPDDPMCEVAFSDSLEYKKYVVTVWGGCKEAPEYEACSSSTYTFPTEGIPADVFVSRDTVVYEPCTPIHDMALKRVSGMLLVHNDRLPDVISSSQIDVSGIFSEVNSLLEYSGRTSCAFIFPFTIASSAGDTRSDRVATVQLPVAPSAAGTTSAVINSYFVGPSQVYTAPKVDVQIERNKITELRYRWEGDQGTTVYQNVDGQWKRISDLGTSEQ